MNLGCWGSIFLIGGVIYLCSYYTWLTWPVIIGVIVLGFIGALIKAFE